MAHLTAADLMAYAKQQARIQAIDYFDPRYPRPDEISAWRRDCRLRDQARRRILNDYPGRLRSSDALIPGSYWGGRLEISSDAIHYTLGQYAPREIYAAVYEYFRSTNTL